LLSPGKIIDHVPPGTWNIAICVWNLSVSKLKIHCCLICATDFHCKLLLFQIVIRGVRKDNISGWVKTYDDFNGEYITRHMTVLR
jgi:hypothetical protein